MKTQMLKLIVASLIIILFTACSKKKEKTEKTQYTIEGILYEADGVSPVGEGHVLDLYRYSNSILFPDLDKNGVKAECTTDAYGRYKLVYDKLNIEPQEFKIRNSSVHISTGSTLLTDIPFNENIQRDLCIKIYSKLLLSFKNIPDYITEMDTLFIENFGQDKYEYCNREYCYFTYPFSGVYEMESHWYGAAYPTVKVGEEIKQRYSHFFWAFGRERFITFLSNKEKTEYCGLCKHTLTGAPYIDEVVLDFANRNDGFGK